MSRTKTPETHLDRATADKVLTADLANLLAKVRSGKPLTRYERELVEQQAKGTRQAGEQVSGFVTTMNALAAALGVSRQLVHYHNRKAGAPVRRQDGRYSLGEWRTYLAERGLTGGNGTTPTTTGRGLRLTFGEGIDAASDALGESMPRIVQAALAAADVKASPAKLAQAGLAVWLFLESRLDALRATHGLASRFEHDPEADTTADGVEYPAAVVELATIATKGKANR